MSVSKEELLHIANLADLKIKDEEIDIYLRNLSDILNYVKILEDVPTEDLSETANANEIANVFRKDEAKEFDNVGGILANASEIERNMFKLPKVIQ